MQITRLNVDPLVVANGDQRQSELRELANQLGGYRKHLLEAGFSEKESFSLIETLLERAYWSTTADREFEALFGPDPEDEDE